MAYEELARHTSRDNLWVLVGDTVYNITGLLDSHPGGTGPLLKWAGRDATYVLYICLTPPYVLHNSPQLLCVCPAMLMKACLKESICPDTSAGDA